MAYIVSTPTCMPEPTWYAGPMLLGSRGNGWNVDMYDPLEEEYAPSFVMSYAAQREAAYRAEMQRRRRQAELQRQYEIELERRRAAALRRRQREAQVFQRVRRQQQRELAGMLEHLTLHELMPMAWLVEGKAHEAERAQRHEEAERRRIAPADKRAASKQQASRPALESTPHESDSSEHIYIDLGSGLRLHLSPVSNSSPSQKKECEEGAEGPGKDIDTPTDTMNSAKAEVSKQETAEPEPVNKGKGPEPDEEHSEEGKVSGAVEEPVAEEHATPTVNEQRDNSAAVKDAPTNPVSLCNYAFPTGDYGKLIRKQVNVDKIDVEADPQLNTIRISGLWAKECPPSRSSSPRSPHVRDVDEFGEEVLLPEDSDASDSESSDKVVFDHAEVVDVPPNADLRYLRAELTDDGFALWLDRT